MPRVEMYPWSMLLEVGDYFAVPEHVKPFSYMSALVSQRNYKFKRIKLVAVRTSYGTVVMVAQVGEEKPPYEYVSESGIMVIEGKNKLRSQDHNTRLGDRPVAAKRSVEEIVARMSLEVKQNNLPWWSDPKTGQVIFNPKIATEEDLNKWYNKEKLPEPYPEYYDLDENLIKRSPQSSDEDDEFFEVLEEGGEQGNEE